MEFYSRTPSPVFSSSDRFSDSSSDDGLLLNGDAGEPGYGASRPGSPGAAPEGAQEENMEVDTMTCRWEECGKVFSHLPTLIEHIHNDHIGVHKSNYTCEWATCPRRGIPQTSRFALISHIRSHTGEKPFVCHLPECDKSFTRSDALAKHMRIQHNISPPLPGRGGSRKRKREEPEPTAPQADPNAYGYSTFKLETNGHPDDADDTRMSPADYPNGAYASGSAGPRPASPEYDEHDEGEDEIPQYLLMQADPQTGLIMGRSPAMVKYLIMKAKQQYALEQHEALVEELRVLRKEERLWKERKDALMDELLHVYFGDQARKLTAPIVMADRHHRSRHGHREGETMS
ncbi:uncharacterized protein B0H18DRAFT_1002920 [Fomitopsis serialis]|uniref:uncharacterized protein n=1 Tax=Fomitopsis serialis TaxID=139415 RepID=UPI0020075C19|nr:uncharacterized protein B0H18DRAFT_1002920 [Neoantrodia serialis]KAH9927636.1 hypothetical protein B0H18DRAFT_1002920 [Neoantrodia serialis]